MKTYHLLRFASWLTKWIPPRLAYWLCQVFGSILFYARPSLRRQALENLRHVLPDASALRKRVIVRRLIRNNFKNYYDLVRLPHLDKDDLENMVTIYGMQHIENAVADGKGVIVISCHMGNFSIVPQLVMTRGYTGAIVAEDIKPEALYNLVNELRSRFGLKFIKAGSAQVRTIYKHLKGRGILMLAADRDLADSGVPVEFFGSPAELPSGPVVLALRLGAALIPAYTVRISNSKSIVHVYPPIDLEITGDREEDVRVNMRKVARTIESMVIKAPDQWVAMLQKIWDKEGSTTASTEPQQEPAPAAGGHKPDGHPLQQTQALDVAPSEERSPSSVS